MSTGTAPRYSARELQAAAAALQAGRFAAPPVPVAARSGSTITTGAIGSAPLARVRAANAGAGASTIALALADAADAAGIRTRVLDAAAPAWSGLLSATVTELGAAYGWRRGRRGSRLLLDRVAQAVRDPSEVPDPRRADDVALTVLDTGWSTRELAAAPDAWIAAAPAQVELLVTRAHDLALSQVEVSLSSFGRRPLNPTIDSTCDLTTAGTPAAGRVVVVVGGSRRSGHTLATAGPRLRALRELDAVLFSPLVRADALPGLGPDRLPKQLTGAAERLLERITTITGPLSADRT